MNKDNTNIHDPFTGKRRYSTSMHWKDLPLNTTCRGCASSIRKGQRALFMPDELGYLCLECGDVIYAAETTPDIEDDE